MGIGLFKMFVCLFAGYFIYIFYFCFLFGSWQTCCSFQFILFLDSLQSCILLILSFLKGMVNKTWKTIEFMLRLDLVTFHFLCNAPLHWEVTDHVVLYFSGGKRIFYDSN